jgi:hypothetical protein
MGTNPSRSDLRCTPGTLVSELSLRGLAARSSQPRLRVSGSSCPAPGSRPKSGLPVADRVALCGLPRTSSPRGAWRSWRLCRPSVAPGEGTNPALSVPRTVVSPSDCSEVTSLGSYSDPWTTAIPDRSPVVPRSQPLAPLDTSTRGPRRPSRLRVLVPEGPTSRKRLCGRSPTVATPRMERFGRIDSGFAL